MGRRRLDHIRGSWVAVIAILCLAAILGFGLGSEKVVRIARERLPALAGTATARDPSFWERPENAPAPEKPPEADPADKLPVVEERDGFRGVVRDAEGRPLAGAEVAAERWRETRWEVLASTRTNREGRFVLGPVARAHLSVVARAEGYASQRKGARTGATLEFSLKRGGNLALRVVDALTGAPIPGVGLRGWSASGSWNEQGETDADGRHRFASVPPGRVHVQVSPPLHRETNLSDLEVREGQETTKEIPVVRGGRLTGRVLDRETGAPVAGATLRTWNGQKGGVSGEDGTYEIPSPPQGGVSLRVSAPEYPEQWAWVQTGGDPGAETKQDVRIGKGGKVSGLVRDGEGHPVKGAQVGRDPGRLMTGVPEQTALTDEEGRFTLDAVPSMANGRLFAIADGFALTRSDPVAVRAGSESAGVVITLQRGALFRGTAKDEDGEPLAGVSFTLNREWTPSDGSWFWIPGLNAYSLPDGSFEIAAVAEGTYGMQVALDGYAPETRRPLVAPAAGEVGGLDFVLRRGGSISGTVRSLDGTPLAGASVNAYGWVTQSDGSRSWNQRSDVRTDENGAFSLDGLRDGAYQVNVVLAGYQAVSLAGIAAGTRDLPVTLEPSARIEGVVVEADGTTPCPAFTLRVVLERTESGDPAPGENVVHDQEYADREGKFLLQDLARGQYALYAVAGSRISARVEGVFLTPGARISDVRLVLVEGGRIRVLVRDLAGNPAPGASVSLARDAGPNRGNAQFWAQTNQDGETSFTAVPDGGWILAAEQQGRLRATRRVAVGAGTDLDVELRLRIGGAALVAVADARGAPVAGATVRFLDPATGQEIDLDWSAVWQEAVRNHRGGALDWNDLQRRARETGEDGRLRRTALPEGAVEAHVTREGFLPARVTVRLIDAFEVDVPVILLRDADGDGREDPADAVPPAGGGGGAPR